jgi:GNAT superfamily N-acetyltransferase
LDWVQLQPFAQRVVTEAILHEGSMSLRDPDAPLPEDLWPPRTGLVAYRRADGRLLGFVALQFFEPSPQHRGKYMDIPLIAVELDARGRGIARGLLRAGMDWAAHWGAAVVHLTVSEGNIAARRLYESAGFSTIDRMMGIRMEPRT